MNHELGILKDFPSVPMVRTLSFQCRGSIPGGEDPTCKKKKPSLYNGTNVNIELPENHH